MSAMERIATLMLYEKEFLCAFAAYGAGHRYTKQQARRLLMLLDSCVAEPKRCGHA